MKRLFPICLCCAVTISGCKPATDVIDDALEGVGAIQAYDYFNRAELGSEWTKGNAFGSYSINNGELEVTCTSTESVAWMRPTGIDAYSDISAEVDIKWISGIENNGSGIMFRDGTEQNEQYRFLISHYGSYTLTYGITPIVAWTASTAITKTGWNTLRVECVDTNIMCYINGAKVIETTSSALTSGYVCLTVSDPQTVHFDNFKAWYWMRSPIGG